MQGTRQHSYFTDVSVNGDYPLSRTWCIYICVDPRAACAQTTDRSLLQTDRLLCVMNGADFDCYLDLLRTTRTSPPPPPPNSLEVNVSQKYTVRRSLLQLLPVQLS